MMRLIRRMAAMAMAASLMPMYTYAQERSTIDYTTQGTDSDVQALPSTEYHYRMNGTQLLNTEVTNIRLSPLSAKYYDISREQFSNAAILYGHLQAVNSSNYTSFRSRTIPYLSCDNSEASGIVESFFNSSAATTNIVVVILYSQRHQFCNISGSLAGVANLSFFSIGTPAEANALDMLKMSDKESGSVTIRPDVVSLPPENPDYSRRKNSPIPMIVLYALTSTITVLLLVVIVGGAIKARRHPERYGPRTILRPRQSRARGIAMAMLETLPIVKFGDSEPNNGKTEPHDADLELNETKKSAEPTTQAAKTGATVEEEGSPADQKPAAKPSNPAEQASTADQALAISVNTAKNDSEPLPQRPTSPQSPNTAESLICSICTEDFVLGEELRVLPCKHRFHPACVDPWLLNVSGTCPLCRIDLRPPQDIAAAAAEDNFPFRIITTGPSTDSARGVDLNDIIPSTVRNGGMERIAGASREERIGILRRWREERRRQQQSLREQETREGESTEMSAPDRRRSKRFSQFLRTLSQDDNHASGASSRSGRPSSLAIPGPEASTSAAASNTAPLPSPLGQRDPSTSTPDGRERASQ